MMFKCPCGCEIRKKLFFAIRSRLIQYNDWSIIQPMLLRDFVSLIYKFQVHRLIAKHFGSFLESKTFNEENQGVTTSFIQVRMRFKPTKASRRQDKQRSVGKRLILPATCSKYLTFIVLLKNTLKLEKKTFEK